MIRVDIVQTDAETFKNVLEELDKEELVSILCGLKSELAKDYESFVFKFEPKVPFEHIRRVTGYLVGSTERWNNAKQNELADRVKHGI